MHNKSNNNFKLFRKRKSYSQSHQKRIESYSHRTKTFHQPTCKKKMFLDQAAQQIIGPFEKGISKCLLKIGTNPSKNSSYSIPHFEPPEQERKSFQQIRYKELKYDLLLRKRKKKIPFEFEMDEVVLGCYNYKEKYGRTSIWQRYRGEVDQLSYQVLQLKK